jgi:hypothetical protein
LDSSAFNYIWQHWRHERLGDPQAVRRSNHKDVFSSRHHYQRHGIQKWEN